MKNFKRAARIFVMIVFLVLGASSCKPEKEKIPTPEPERTPVKAPDQIVSVKQAKMMYDAYGERRVRIIEKYENEQNPEEKFDVARFGSYDYQTIKNYLRYIEQEAEKANVEIATLRFYFSNYPDQNEFEDGRKIKHPKQNSFFLIPTTRDEKNGDYAFYIYEDNDGNNIPMYLTDNLNPKNSANNGPDKVQEHQNSEASLVPKLSKSILFDKNKSLILNEGDMTPPPYRD
ncbi:hypothetical protein [Arenibacter certesii]|uniref:Lipoprotein n=1 Tax=Arenibacter certesii TaxID=228955 RepID=A0A918IQT2_9FLAO|nr:hypothetical protein [Arenibacter certesii]GGW27669.1 hypothetical protein GCM10007383_11400 [Arenibacter certesii]